MLPFRILTASFPDRRRHTGTSSRAASSRPALFLRVGRVSPLQVSHAPPSPDSRSHLDATGLQPVVPDCGPKDSGSEGRHVARPRAPPHRGGKGGGRRACRVVAGGIPPCILRQRRAAPRSSLAGPNARNGSPRAEIATSQQTPDLARDLQAPTSSCRPPPIDLRPQPVDIQNLFRPWASAASR